jgi:hypothetical protein
MNSELIKRLAGSRKQLAESLNYSSSIRKEAAERGCLSRSTFDKPKTRGISYAHSAIRAAAGGTPALRSIWATRPKMRSQMTCRQKNEQ